METTTIDYSNESMTNQGNLSVDGNRSIFYPPYKPFDQYGTIRIPLYSLIFVLSVTGNILVILTLVQNRRMRTVTNVFLLNLSISDLLLAVFCMPFTLIPQLMRNFIFGEFMCISIRYFQAVSVGVSCFTLVTISLERYFAIVEPLRSRRWQTRSHSYKCLIAIWISSLVLMLPIALSQELRHLRTRLFACREIWAPHLRDLEIAYSITLCCFLFVIPMLIMGLAYGCISYKLWVDIRQQLQDNSADSPSKQPLGGVNRRLSCSDTELSTMKNGSSKRSDKVHVSLRHSNMRNSVGNRKRVIKMLFVIVLEYFICWTPLYVISTWKIVDYMSIHDKVSPMAWSLVLLLAYASSFIHPVTYCFMNKNFRKGFVSAFRCFFVKGPLNGHSGCTEMSQMHHSSSPSCRNNGDYSYSKVAPEK